MTADRPGARARRTPSGAAVLRQELTETITEAVLDELAEHGYGRLSMDAVARRAGVGKSALYRRWPSKQDMVVDVVSRLSVPMAEVPDTGSLRGDVLATLHAILDWLNHPRFGRVLPDLLAEAVRGPVLADALAAHIGEPRRTRGAAVLDRAIARGEISGDVDRDVVLDLLAAPLYWRLRGRHTPVTPEYLESLADALVRMLTAPTPSSAGRRGSRGTRS
ncbi:transcriptional regulator, TetR family [Streptoalloteichus tenebrarius]|uniref:Transcriptional regulator, TetR family n=1 Tax=Streptoalloteichus tenebrarius (strain ATCC 17920 / DSM 40477 / JCM 4838 / CBS 697.72 / NBRC 16177 / NCIMB 11028 / NRRL B-12390 / A12253. 1 / ISP 5477) TaxID=1933 RepID=A0ABT1HWT9_STRSD|nr:TetR/AcrR family transcriptional regulator [Streptoalloteichus tenebrarius]MCP2259997.1 transcriptional regulator, TetR family [Streptoalloteichus tenebrarius]BFF03890.1 TetR/AcrR family transcriptional regulator [Streptoalloteichus tenebrarius]